MRAIRSRYDPYEQARSRVDQLKTLGHSVDKVHSHIIRFNQQTLNLNPPFDTRYKFSFHSFRSSTLSWVGHLCLCLKIIVTGSS